MLHSFIYYICNRLAVDIRKALVTTYIGIMQLFTCDYLLYASMFTRLKHKYNTLHVYLYKQTAVL